MNTNKSLRDASASAQSLAGQALASGETALDNTRQLALHALEKAGDTVREMRLGARDTAAAAQQRLNRYADLTGRYVAEQPVKSALVAAAIGAVVAGIIIAARRRSDRQTY